MLLNSEKEIIFLKLKRLFKYLLSIILAFTVIMSLLTGCGRNIDNEQSSNSINIPGVNNQHPEYVYIPEVIQFPELPDGMENISNVVLTDNAVYFTAHGYTSEQSVIAVNNIFSMDVDGTNMVKLPDYIARSFLPEKTMNIDTLHVDNEGYLWVLESMILYEQEKIDLFAVIRKLNDTGAELMSFDVSDLVDSNYSWFYTPSLNTDSAGNIYFASAPKIHVFDYNGNLLFNLDEQSSTNLIRLSDGTVALSAFGEIGTHLKIFDINNKSWGEIVKLSSGLPVTQNVFSGSGEYLFFYNEGSYLTGILTETGEHINVLSWIESTLSPNDITNIMLLSDGRFTATKQTRDNQSSALPVTELLLLTKTSIDDLPERITLIYGTFQYDSDQSYIIEQFNRKSDSHYIQVKDYSQYNTADDITLGLLRLNTEMIAGSAPDILDVWILPAHNYVSKGYLVDLYPLLDADEELSRDIFIESVLKAMEINGSLYRISPSFIFNSIVGSPMVLGSYPGWNMDEFIAVFDANPQADKAAGAWSSKIYFLSMLLTYNWDDYVDRETGAAYFDSKKFINLLELANTFPSETDNDPNIPVNTFDLISEGRQIMEMMPFGTVAAIEFFRTMFGDEIVFKGFPTEKRNGNSFTLRTSIAITNTCKEIDAAWEFVRMFLTEDYQRDFTPRSFPINKELFEERLYMAMHSSGGAGDPLSQEEVDRFKSAINNTTRLRGDVNQTLWEIVTESASEFFNGQMTAENAARIIQSRATIYIVEQR